MVTNGIPMGPSGLGPVQRNLMQQVYVGFAIHVAYHVVAGRALEEDDPNAFLAEFLEGFREEFQPQMEAAVNAMIPGDGVTPHEVVSDVLDGIWRDVHEVMEKVVREAGEKSEDEGADENGGE